MGKLIVIDGLDGCGKSTQLDMVYNHIQQVNDKVKKISYPCYDKPSSGPINMYLGGDISENLDDINTYAASMFYSVDRYIGYMTDWKKYYDDNYTILSARYTSSNLIHQMCKLDKSRWDEYIDWLQDIEYKRFGLPVEDKVIYLSMDIDASQSLMTSRYNGNESKKDIHESNIDYMKKCRESANYITDKYPDKWTLIKCNEGDRLFSIQEITDKIISVVNKII